jgi:uncharacterized protein
MQRIKVVVSGAFNAGKTQFIKTLSEIAIVETERRVTDHTRAIKPFTTAAMDYGRITLPDQRIVHAYGTPGQRRFDFMWTALARGMRGLILLVDSTAPQTFAETLYIRDFLLQATPVPYLVAANKRDQPKALSLPAIREALQLEPATPLVPCVAVDRTSVVETIHILLSRIPISAELSDTMHVPLPPVRPCSPALVAAIRLPHKRTKDHLTRGAGVTLCGRTVPAGAIPITVFTAADCRTCDQRARRLGLTCADCRRPLIRSADGRLCLGCAQQHRRATWDKLGIDAFDTISAPDVGS